MSDSKHPFKTDILYLGSPFFDENKIPLRVELRLATRRERHVFEGDMAKASFNKLEMARIIREASKGSSDVAIAEQAVGMITPERAEEKMQALANLICPCVLSIKRCHDIPAFNEYQELGNDFLELLDWEPLDFSMKSDDQRVDDYFEALDENWPEFGHMEPVKKTGKGWRRRLESDIEDAQRAECKLEMIVNLKGAFERRDKIITLAHEATALGWERMTPSEKGAACNIYYKALFRIIEGEVFPQAEGMIVGKSTSQPRRARSLKR